MTQIPSFREKFIEHCWNPCAWTGNWPGVRTARACSCRTDPQCTARAAGTYWSSRCSTTAACSRSCRIVVLTSETVSYIWVIIVKWNILSVLGRVSRIPRKRERRSSGEGCTNISFCQIFQKMHEIEKILGLRGRPLRSANVFCRFFVVSGGSRIFHGGRNPMGRYAMQSMRIYEVSAQDFVHT